MYDVEIICAYRHLSPLLDQLREYCHRTEHRQLVEIADFGFSQKLVQARITVRFLHHPVDPVLITQLDTDSRVLDYYLPDDESETQDTSHLPVALVPRRATWY